MNIADKERNGTLQEKRWLAVRTFNCQEQKISRYLAERNCVHFIPMKLAVAPRKDNEAPKRVLVPAVHNLLFVQQQENQQETLQLLKDCGVPVSVYRLPGTNRCCEIPDREMVELRLLCDPKFSASIYLDAEEAEVMIGKKVRVINGTFKGSVGQLVRKKKKYYLLKVIAGMGIMVRIPRWYCEPID